MIQSRSQQPIKSTLRLTFQYDGETIQLRGIRRVNMIAPPSDGLSERPGASGFWYEVRDATNRTLYRRVMDMPNRYAVEVRSDDPAMPLKWDPIERPQGVFVILVPALDAAQDLVVLSSPIRPSEVPTGEAVRARRELEPAQEIARFSLSDADPERR